MKQENLKYTGQTTLTSILPKVLGAIAEHNQYWELFCGTCQVFRAKNQAPSILVDKNQDIVSRALSGVVNLQGSHTYLPVDVFEVLEGLISNGSFAGISLSKDAFIYLDPPWRISMTGSKKPLYRFNLTDNDTARLLLLIRRLPVKVAILHYTDAFYDDILNDWHRLDMRASFRGRSCGVSLYCNYNPIKVKPAVLHVVGLNKTDRQRIKRKAARWILELDSLPVYERHVITQAIKKKFDL